MWGDHNCNQPFPGAVVEKSSFAIQNTSILMQNTSISIHIATGGLTRNLERKFKCPEDILRDGWMGSAGRRGAALRSRAGAVLYKSEDSSIENEDSGIEK